MTYIARAKLQAVSDGPFTIPPRSATIISLSTQKQNSARWWIPIGLLTLLAGATAGASWNNNNLRLPHISISLEMPDLRSFFMADAESNSGYAETMNPPPADVVVPIPIVSELPPSLEKVAGNSVDLSAGISLPASSLQVPDPAAADPVPAPSNLEPEHAAADVAAVVAAIHDTPALSEIAKPQIEVKNVDAPVIGRMMEEARLNLDNGDNEEALAIYNRVLAHQHGNRSALAGQAFAAQRAGEYEIAIKAERQLLVLDPHNEAARINLVAALSAWDAPLALKELQHMVEAKPDFAPGQVALAQRLAAEGKMLQALPHMEHAVELEPDNIFYKLDLAVTYDKLGHSGEAIDLYHDVLKMADALDSNAPALPVSRTTIRQRANYLEKLMASVENISAE